jgi:hypothetical protein
MLDFRESMNLINNFFGVAGIGASSSGRVTGALNIRRAMFLDFMDYTGCPVCAKALRVPAHEAFFTVIGGILAAVICPLVVLMPEASLIHVCYPAGY